MRAYIATSLLSVLLSVAAGANAHGEQAFRGLALLPPLEKTTDRVRFAAGAIELSVPAEWSVSEADFSRHVRLYITPNPMVNASSFGEGVWISYQVQPTLPSTEKQLLAAMRKHAADAIPPDAMLRPLESPRISEWAALKQPFEVATEEHGSSQGYHLLVATDWGIVALHARYSSGTTARLISRIIHGLVLGQPRVAGEVASEFAGPIADARQVLGAWKAERARLLLAADGTIELTYDRQRPRQIDQVHLARPTRRLLGDYEARGDVLYVTWKDGSHLNLRWSTTPGELLLTDHQGRVSQLNRLLE